MMSYRAKFSFLNIGHWMYSFILITPRMMLAYPVLVSTTADLWRAGRFLQASPSASTLSRCTCHIPHLISCFAQVFDYYNSGAESESTVRFNREAFGKMRLLPRMLVDVSKIDTSVELLGA